MGLGDGQHNFSVAHDEHKLTGQGQEYLNTPLLLNRFLGHQLQNPSALEK